MMKIETTTSKQADLTSNTKLEKDPIIDSINRKRLLARMGKERLDKEVVGDQTWLDIKDQTWPERQSPWDGGSEIQHHLKYPVYTEEDWYIQLDEKDKERVTDLIAAERMILNEAPIYLLSRPNSMYIRFFVHRPFYADLEYMIY